MTFSVGTTSPTSIEPSCVPIELAQPINLSLDKLFEKNTGCNVLFVSVPGAFIPNCTENNIAPYLDNLASVNDAFLNNAWGKLLLKNAKLGAADQLPTVIFASDPNAKFSQDNGISVDLTGMGLGVRTARNAFIFNADTRTMTYLGAESGFGVTASGLKAVQAVKF
ncbi:hypothetical protein METBISCDRAFT_25494 [Metschnikowia bicuspidata]|uniref:Redoxin domain-containing protein n=1 Tax=Metschnikowia bicuspidata TaxID=27322 RepID=A0A4P9ZJH4_9ASCO|nr:hypothetical protein METBISCDRAFT_25494 [Metschnikowia bicuspidata]